MKSNYKLNCIVLGDCPCHVFPVDIRQTQTVGDLKSLIKEEKKHAFRNVDADSLVLWNVHLPVDDTFEHNLSSLKPDPEQCLSPVAQLFKVFELSEEDHLHIVVHPLHTVPVVPQNPVVRRRLAYLERSASLSSLPGAKPAADPLPVTLLEPIFAEFVDDCQNHQPTAHDNEFVRQLSQEMTSFYPDELTWMNAFRQLLHDYGINASIVGSTKCTTDGHLLSRSGTFIQVISEGKNKIGSGGAEPFAEAMLYYRKFMKDSKIETVRPRSVIPCIHIIVFGACIGFVGSIFIDKVQYDVLAPIIPLFCHITNLPMQVTAARTFGALKIATEKLTKLYSQPIPRLEVKDASPYPRSYTCSSGQIQEFSYYETQMLRDKYVFFGETVGDAAGRQICIKFARSYSREVHDFCASKGHAPELIAYKPLAGGWNMVIMDALDIGIGYWPGSYQPLSAMAVLDRQPLKEAITSLIEELHNYNGGYVHGDLRDTNFFVGDNKGFMLLDFDWAGPIGKARYPAYLNRSIRRPDGARDGEKIVAKHDLDMLRYIFHTEEDDRETAAKRRRISTGEGSAMGIP